MRANCRLENYFFYKFRLVHKPETQILYVKNITQYFANILDGPTFKGRPVNEETDSLQITIQPISLGQ